MLIDYTGKTLEIHTPTKSRLIDIIYCTKHYENGTLAGESKMNGLETAYYLSDGICVKVLN